jgi:hypothetical protein
MNKLLSCYKSISKNQFVKSLAIAFFGALITQLYQSIFVNHQLPTVSDLKADLTTAIGAAIAYLKVSFWQNSQGQLFTKEPGAPTSVSNVKDFRTGARL